MNIIEARAAAMAGETVINCHDGKEWDAFDFKNCKSLWSESVFGKWKIKIEPVVFEAEVSIANETLYGSGVGMIADRELRLLIGKRVKVSVEVIE